MSTLRYIFRNFFQAPRNLELWSAEQLEEIIRPYRGRWMNDPDLCALEAIIASKKGETDRIPGLLEECRRIPVQIDLIRTAFLKEFNIPPEEWERLVLEKDPEFRDMDARDQARIANPGYILTESQTESPHWFGGGEFKMPPCCCGGWIRQYVFLSVHQIPELKPLLPNWKFLPILGCNECSIHLFQHDYEINVSKRKVKLVNILIREEQVPHYGKPGLFLDYQPPVLPKTFAKIQTIESIERELLKKYGSSYINPCATRIGGEPNWQQEIPFVHCRRCREKMIHYASLGSGWGPFDPPICINNDSGYHFHFACPNCHSISVIPQWS